MVLLMKMEKYSVKIGLGYFAVSTYSISSYSISSYSRTCPLLGFKMTIPFDMMTGAISKIGSSASAFIICHWPGFCSQLNGVHLIVPLPVQALWT